LLKKDFPKSSTRSSKKTNPTSKKEDPDQTADEVLKTGQLMDKHEFTLRDGVKAIIIVPADLTFGEGERIKRALDSFVNE
jgi:hypothetical protein